MMKITNNFDSVINSSSFASIIRCLLEEAEGRSFVLRHFECLWSSLYEK